MVRMIKLATTELPTENQAFRKQLIQNFEIIQDELNDIEEDLDNIRGKLDDSNSVVLNAENIEMLVQTLADYGVPVTINNGKIEREDD